MHKECNQCGNTFDFTPEDRAQLDKYTVHIGGHQFPIPDYPMCFDCRLQRRLAFYNGRNLYKRECDITKQPIISIFKPGSAITVMEVGKWFGDDWDGMDYGREYDFSRPFFEQFRELMEVVPMPSRAIIGMNQNSDYTSDNWKLKNCYMVFDCEQGEDCYYGQTFECSKDCVDFLSMSHCEVCYEIINCNQCYNLFYSRYCVNCHSSWFLRDCVGCRDCFGCINLRQKQYCIYNEQKTREEYEAFMHALHTGSHTTLQTIQKQVEEFFTHFCVRDRRGEQNQDALGDNIHNSKDAYMCFDCGGMHDCRYMTNCLMGAKDSADIHIWGLGMEQCFNNVVVGSNPKKVMCSHYVTEGVSDIQYSLFCSRKSSHLFGCVGLRHKEYCILNTQYTKDDYEHLVARIIQQMIDDSDWGQYFPPEISMYGYNETEAARFFPLSQEDVEAKGWQWNTYEAPVEAKKVIPASQLPDNISDVPDDILEWAITCEDTGKPFKVVEQELRFYRTHNLPIPHRHPDQRHLDRHALKNPFRMYERNCGKCGKDIATAYSEERGETVYCSECYLAEVY